MCGYSALVRLPVIIYLLSRNNIKRRLFDGGCYAISLFENRPSRLTLNKKLDWCFWLEALSGLCGKRLQVLNVFCSFHGSHC